MCSSDRSLNAKVLPGPTPIFASFARIALSLGVSGTNCSAASRYSKKFCLDAGGGGRNEIDLRRGGRGGLLQESGKRPRLVAGLNLLDVRHVAGIEELRADKRERERRRRSEDLLDPGGRSAFPVGADHQIVARLGPRGAGADIAEIVGVAVDQLDRVVAVLFDRRHRDDHRFGAQIQPKERVRGVAVRRDDCRILRRGDVVLVVDFVERRLELPRIPVHGELLHHRVVHHERQAVDEAFFGDVLGLQQAGPLGFVLRKCRGGLRRRGGERGHRGRANQVAFRQHLNDFLPIRSVWPSARVREGAGYAAFCDLPRPRSSGLATDNRRSAAPALRRAA